MNKFQKLAQLNRDIELLENAGKIKAADVLHQKFIKESQFMMSQMPMMMMPQMMPMMPQMMARPTMPVSQPTNVVRPMAVPVTTPVANPQVTPAPTPVAPPRTTTPPSTSTPPPTVNPPAPPAVKPPAPPKGQPVSDQTNPYDNSYYDQQKGRTIFVDPITGDPYGDVSGRVNPPGGVPNPRTQPGLEGPNTRPDLPPAPAPSPGTTPPTGRQNQLGNFFKGKIDKFFITNPKPSIEDQYTFIGNLEDQLRQYRDNGNLTQQQYDDLSNQLFVR